jgi:thiosulfate/3-mercaptopyruvate sulfurtransferase
MLPINQRGYAHPDVLVSTDWVQQHLNDSNIRIMESNEDLLLYETGHIPNAVKIDWVIDLNDPLTRDYVSSEKLQAFLRSRGVNNDTTIVLYGDKNNWWATYAFWVLKLFDIENIKIMDGGRLRWEQEQRPMETSVPKFPEGNIEVGPRDDGGIRAFRDEVLQCVNASGKLVDVRSPEEYRGERLHMPEYPNEGAMRGGHIPGARNVPWARAIDAETHLFKSADELSALYTKQTGLEPGDPVIAYCRIGERSSHTWFVLTYLLGFERVKNYDGSWTEWGNLVGSPIERP